jgi:hypothetical protein
MKKLQLLLIGLSTSALSLNGISQTYTFTTCGATGMSGPNTAQVTTAYAGTSLDGAVTETNGIQQWTVPATGNYSIACYGAQGGNNGGLGAYSYGEVTLNAGTVLSIVAGQEGFTAVSSSNSGGGGGGGSFVVDGTNPLVIAGGGGGFVSVYSTYIAPYDPTISDGQATNDGATTYLGGGGTGGNGGDQGLDDCCMGGGASGGGGLLTDGTLGAGGGPGIAFLNGCMGGPGDTEGEGGFGGGAGSSYDNAVRSGGGGGYSGGQGGSFSMLYQTTGAYCHGGGGGSYSSGSNQTMTAGMNTGDGYIVITVLCSPLTVNASATTICDGDGVTLTATSSNGGTITWDNGVQDGVAFDPPVGTTTYTATSSDGNDCGYSIDITVNAAPSATMTAMSQDCFYDYAYALTGGAPAGGVYSGNGVINDDVFDPGLAGIGTHTITYTVIDPATGCAGTATTDVVVDECLAVEELTSEISVYPNPAHNDVNIVLDGEFEYSILNTVGQEISTGKGSNTVAVDLTKFATGPYLLRVTNSSGTKTIKILKR